MASLAYVLLLAVAAAMSNSATGDDTIEHQMTMIMEKGCLPDDFQPYDFSECKDKTPLAVKLQCIATSSGFSTNSGYDQASAEAFIDARSSDEEWRARQKELLEKCASMLVDEVSADNEGVFVQECWIQLMVQDCNKQRFVELAVAVDAENGEKVAEQVALRTEGACFENLRFNYPDELTQKWFACVIESGLAFDVLTATKAYYNMIAMDSDSLPELTAENVTAIADELEKLEAISECYAMASGEVSSDGTINYDIILASIDEAKDKQPVKDTAKKLVEFCQSQEPVDINEFYACFLEYEPLGCVALKSYALINELFGR